MTYLETPDSSLPALLWNFLRKVLPGSSSVRLGRLLSRLLEFLLLFFGDFSVELVGGSLGSGIRVDATIWSPGSIATGFGDILGVSLWIALVYTLQLALDVGLRNIGLVMPGIVGGRLINAGKGFS